MSIRRYEETKALFRQKLNEYNFSPSDSVTIVARQLELKHFRAAEYINQKHDLPVSAYALHNIIDKWDEYVFYASLPIDTLHTDIEISNDFSPRFFLEYLQTVVSDNKPESKHE